MGGKNKIISTASLLKSLKLKLKRLQNKGEGNLNKREKMIECEDLESASENRIRTVNFILPSKDLTVRLMIN